MRVKRGERLIVPESFKVKRTREKLIKLWAAEREQITPGALEETVEKIHRWIASHSKFRASIKGKGIKLFNQNKEAARLSKKVQAIARKLK